VLRIDAIGTIADQPIAGSYLVESDGRVALGPAYGRVQVKGLTLDAAEKAIRKKLMEVLTNPQVQVTFGGWKGEGGSPANVPKAGKHGLE
jgi:polysaccharide biosynthesis/export protein